MTILDALRIRGVPVRVSQTDRSEIRICCPFCQARGFSSDQRFRLGLDLRRGWGHCFNCGWKSRNAVSWLSKQLELGAVEFVSARQKSEQRTKKVIQLPEGYTPLKEVWADPFPWYRMVRAYLYDRRMMTRKEIFRLRVGITLVGKYAYRAIFPIYYQGKLRGFVGRGITDEQKPPYLNSVGEKWLFNSPDRPSNAGRKCILVEGIFDCVRLHRLLSEKYDVMAVLGHSLTEKQEEVLLPYRKVVLWSDPDSAGITGFLRVAEQMHFAGKKVQIVPPTLLRDVDTYPDNRQVLAAFQNRLEWSVSVSLELRRKLAFR